MGAAEPVVAVAAGTCSTPRYDVLVVGGGINGAAIARDLSGRHLRVLLCEQDDLASHTSSASTKLVHGGLRYLEQREFGLVRKALAEREVLLASAPHRVRPLRFVLPAHSRARRRPRRGWPTAPRCAWCTRKTAIAARSASSTTASASATTAR
jgi:glycerol-3-phosphate dehydrogenase